MPAALFKLFNDRDAELGTKVVGIFCLLIAANVLAWVWALIAFRDYPVLLGTALLAYASVCATPSTPTTSRPSTTSRAS